MNEHKTEKTPISFRINSNLLARLKSRSRQESAHLDEDISYIDIIQDILFRYLSVADCTLVSFPVITLRCPEGHEWTFRMKTIDHLWGKCSVCHPMGEEEKNRCWRQYCQEEVERIDAGLSIKMAKLD